MVRNVVSAGQRFRARIGVVLGQAEQALGQAGAGVAGLEGGRGFAARPLGRGPVGTCGVSWNVLRHCRGPLARPGGTGIIMGSPGRAIGKKSGMIP